MEAREFKNGDVVYAQDGEVFSFDHAVGEWAYLYPSVLIQTTNYQGDDFEEHEEWAEHLVRRKLTTIAKKPWLQQIDADSRHLLSVRQSELDALSAKIGTARVELATAERALADREKALIAERSKLERRYQWVGDIKRMLGEEDSEFFALGEEGEPPVAINAPWDIRLKRSINEEGKYFFLAEYDCEQDNIQIFANERARENAVVSLYLKIKDPDIATQRKWHKWWDFIPLSAAAQDEIDAEEAHALSLKIETATRQRDQAQAKLDGLVPPLED